ncbi:FAD-dependent oxidoreductase [Paenalcaligenes hominis]|uniref:FAD-dependent oxidoreductase n=1 Tax=Paenalcaligenes hominis TaxID=643674 RepID=UPI0035242F58
MNTVDVLVLGGGAAGLSTAAFAKLEGLDVLVCEKTAQVGGISSTSGGTIWAPGTHLSHEAGVPDTVEAAREFLSHVVKSERGRALREAFISSSPMAIKDLTTKTAVRLVASKAHPDYLGPFPGEAYGGRALAPLPFDGRKLGPDFKRIRAPRPEFMGLGGMMVNRTEVDALLNPFSSWANFKTTFSLVGRYAMDRLRYHRGTRLVMGNALIAQLLFTLKQLQVPVQYKTTVQKLLYENGAVVGAVLDGPTGISQVAIRKGVVLATGGMGWNPRLRQQLLPEVVWARSMAPATHTGDGLTLGQSVGGALANEAHPALWFPCSVLARPNAEESIWPHIILDRAKPGLIAVNGAGQRFVNESASYHDFCEAQLAQEKKGIDSVPAYLICDSAFVALYGLGLLLPGASVKRKKQLVQQGYLVEASTLKELAQRLNLPEEALEKTVQQHNHYAQTGVDLDFGKGTSAMNRFNGDAAHKGPNPCLGEIAKGPFYALAVRPVDLAASVGLSTNENAQVLDQNQQPIAGLYACGNDLASIFDGTYPGPGTTLGPGLVFGWRIAKHAAGRL